MKGFPQFLRDERGNVFAYLALTASACVLLSGGVVWLSSPDISAIVADVTHHPSLAYSSDGYVEGIAIPEKPAKIVFIGDKQ